MAAPGNWLYYGDNLDVLGRHVKDESVDLVYLDPPFKSNQDYNVLFAERDGSKATAQVKAFEDTWTWSPEAAMAFEQVVEQGGRLAEAMRAFQTLMPSSDMLAYLSMMAPRLARLRSVLKPSGSIYLHCDPTSGHYLKVLMDAVFDPRNFRSEIVWRRTGSHGKARRYAPIHDTLLFYARASSHKWNWPKRPYMRGHVEQYFVRDERGWRTNYYGNVLTGSGRRHGESGKPWKGFDPTAKNRHWAVPGALVADLEEDFSGLSQHQKLDRLYELGHITITEGQAWPMYERYLKPEDGQATPDIWAFQPYTQGTVFDTERGIDEDVRWLSTTDQERLGYQTQKPEGLLERIIRASSDEGDIVLDPFCGCGTAVAAAHKLKRRWIGIDITQAAIVVIRHRLGRLGLVEGRDYSVRGEPVSLEDAAALAVESPYQFQWWVLGKVGARPAEERKGPDKGIDGRLYFFDDPRGGRPKQVVLSVKSGTLKASEVRDLRGVLARERADMAVLLTLHPPTRTMLSEVAAAGFYTSPWGGTKHARLQILTVKEILDGRRIDAPPIGHLNITFKKPPATAPPRAVQLPIDQVEQHTAWQLAPPQSTRRLAKVRGRRPPATSRRRPSASA